MKKKTFDVKEVIIYARHEFNWLPEMTPEEFELLINNIKEFGFDHRQPIIIYQGKILDGWQRYLAEMAIIAEFKTAGKNFDIMIPSYYDMTAELNDDLAIELVKRMMIRRNQPAETIIANFIKCSAMMKMIQQKVTDAANKKRSEKLQGNSHASKDKQTEVNPPLTDLNDTEKADDKKQTEVNSPLTDPKKEENSVVGQIVKELGGGDITRTKVENVVNLQKTDPEDFGKVVKGKTIKEVKKEKSENPPHIKVKPKGNGHASDALFEIQTTKDVWFTLRAARVQILNEEANLAPARKVYANDPIKLLEVETQILKNIGILKSGLAEDLTEEIEEEIPEKVEKVIPELEKVE